MKAVSVIVGLFTFYYAYSAPRWLMDPLSLSEAWVNQNYSFQLKEYVASEDMSVLKFSLKVGPQWMRVSPEGKVTGTPSRFDVGDFTAVFEVTDLATSISTGARGKVVKINQPPQIFSEQLSFQIKAKETKAIYLNQSQYVWDPDQDALKFFIEPNSWAHVTTEGILTLKPTMQQLGEKKLLFSVSDSTLQTSSYIQVNVLANPSMPIWLEDPIFISALNQKETYFDLSKKTKELDGLQLTFKKLSGPTWVQVQDNGMMVIHPNESNLGTFQVTAQLSNGYLSATSEISVSVLAQMASEKFKVDGATPSETEIVWLLDPASVSLPLIQLLSSSLQNLSQTFESEKVRSLNMLVSSDAQKWDGLPTQMDSQPIFTNNNFSYEFEKRFQKIISENRNNSPLWSLFRMLFHFSNSTTMTDKFFKAENLTDILVFTNQRDHYQKFSMSEPQRSWNAEDYGDALVRFSENSEKKIRTHFFSRACPLIDRAEETTYTAPIPSYSTFSDKTLGTMNDSCLEDFSSQFRLLIGNIIFRAKTFHNKRLKLLKTPMTSTQIKVLLDGKELSDAWTYDLTNNELWVHWERVDLTQLKPGMEIEVQYRLY